MHPMDVPASEPSLQYLRPDPLPVSGIYEVGLHPNLRMYSFSNLSIIYSSYSDLTVRPECKIKHKFLKSP